MKKCVSLISLALALSMYTGAFAMEVPTDTVVQNLNGSQQVIKTFTVAPDEDPQTLIEEPFELEGYCRENKSTPNVLSRELVKETVNQRTNQYEKLANIHYDKADQRFGYDDLTYDENVDAMKYCIQAERLFELYQTCANRKQIETICLKFLRSLDATKISVNGHLYFVPRHTMEQVVVFETFIEEVSRLNRNNTPLFANSFYLIDDAKQRDKMTEEFYLAVKKEIAQYQERADYFIQSGCSSPSTMERWVVKIQALEEKKRRYEDILRRELSGLDEEFESLRLLSQELSLRARGIRSRKAA